MSHNKDKFGIGIVIGLLIGAVTALLTAPQSGKKTRQDIKDKAKEARGVAERKLKDYYKELSNISDDLKKSARNLSGKAKDEANEYIKKADALKDKIKTAITTIKNGDGSEDETNLEDVLNEAKNFMTTMKNRTQSAIKNTKE